MSRLVMKRWLVLVAALVAAMAVQACAVREGFIREEKEVKRIIKDVRKAHQDTIELSKKIKKGQPGKECGFKELAQAESELDFAEYESQMGDYLRAKSHLEAARKYAKQARKKATAWEEPYFLCKPPDRDGDGILDYEDKCPDEPEDFDKFNDSDGCPDPDNDKDGILDTDDKCPDDPEDEDQFEDEDGCPDLDNDEDGIPDNKDQCPNEPEDIDKFEDGDGCPDPDNDKDNICDPWVVKEHKEDEFDCTGEDQCPNKAETYNNVDDEDGCPETDTDGDGLLDAMDKCPTEPETFNGYQDEDGCPDQIPAKKYAHIIVTENRIELKQKIFFRTGKAKIMRKSYGILDEVAQALKDNPNIRVRIEGHTDSRGSRRFNLKLSQRRAEAVRDYLIRKGIDPDRLEAKGYGPDRPIASNKTKRGRAKNRRVEFHILKSGH